MVGDIVAQSSTDKITLDELQGGRADHHRVRCGEAGQLGRYVGGVPQSWLHAPVTTAKGTDHRYARVNPHLHGEFYSALPLELLRQPRHAPHDLQCRMGSPASIVFMSVRVSKVDHKPIAKMLGH